MSKTVWDAEIFKIDKIDREIKSLSTLDLAKELLRHVRAGALAIRLYREAKEERLSRAAMK